MYIHHNERHENIAKEKKSKYLFTYDKGDLNLSCKIVADVKQMRIQCIDCGEISDVVDSNLIRRKSCPKCHNGDDVKIIINGKKFRRINRHKEIVESDGSTYIGTYVTGEILENGRKVRYGESVLRVKCSYVHCQQEYDVRLSEFTGPRKQRCTKCCHEYENSFAYHIEQELNEPINLYWNFDKNEKNPYCIPKYYNGKVNINCIECSYHETYEINCSHFVAANHKTKDGKVNPCSFCVGKSVHYLDSIEIKEPWMVKWLVNPDDGKKYKPGSSISVPMKDPVTNISIGDRKINQLYVYKGVGSISGGRRKIGERYFSKLLQSLNIDYDTQVGKNEFPWLKEYKKTIVLESGRTLHIKDCKYDFLLYNNKFYKEINGKKYSIIIEIDDSTHITGIKDRTALDMKHIDFEKDKIAYNNSYYVIRIPFPDLINSDNYKKYITESEFSEYINMNNISESVLDNCLKFSLYKVVNDSVKLYEQEKDKMTLKDMAKELRICPDTLQRRLSSAADADLCSYTNPSYSERIKDTIKIYNRYKDTKALKEIAAILNITPNTLRKRLVDGSKLGLCVYNPHTQQSNSLRKNNKIKVICLTINQIFESKKSALKWLEVKHAHIGDCCLGKRKYAGKHPITGEKLQWAYYTENS